MVINRAVKVLPVVAVVLALSACSGNEGMAVVMCEDFVDQRVGAGELEHLSPMDGAEVEQVGDDRYVVTSAFTVGGQTSRYTCTVTQDGDQWTLVDLDTGR